MRAIILACILAVIIASCALAQGEVQNVYAPLQPVKSSTETKWVVVRETADTTAIEAEITELKSEWRREHRRSSYDPAARARANELSKRIITLQSQLADEAVTRATADANEARIRQSADNVLSGRIANEAATRRQGDEDNRLFMVGVAVILVAGLAGVAFLATR